jgi:hypothetical protein
MPVFRSSLFALFLAFHAKVYLFAETDNWFSSFNAQSPVRMDQLSGDRIVEMARSSYSVPLIFPKSVSIFERMDESLPKLYTLNQLASNPGLSPIHKFHSSKPIAKKSKVPSLEKSLNLAEREKQLFDTSLLLVPKNSLPLPSDDQLQAFLDEGRKRYTPPVDSQEIIDNLLKDEYANHPVVSLLNDSPEVKKALKSESFNRSTGSLFGSANLALKTPVSSSFSSSSSITGNLPETQNSKTNLSEVEGLTKSGQTILKLQARKPSRDGTLQPAQASEIYLTTQDLRELLKDLTTDPAVAGEVRSVAELWAKAEKNVSQNPEVALGVKSILLSAKVGRARTDPYGQASLENLSPDDKYYIIGIDKDVDTNVVTIWSKEVEVAPGENLVELTSTDVIYQE